MRKTAAPLLSAGVLLGAAGAGMAFDDRFPGHALGWHGHNENFNRIATFSVYTNNANLSDETVAEIVSATKNGTTLVYTDGELETIGFVDISDPADPQPEGTLAVGGEPTSVSVLGDELALVGVNTSESFTNPSGKLVVVDIQTRTITGEIELGGQPDSVAISPDGNFAAVAIENERDEEICVGGVNDGQFVDEDDDDAIDACENGGGVVGGLPQTPFGNPPGELAIVDIVGNDVNNWTLRKVALTGLAAYAPEDPEPEFVDINDKNQAAVTLQENNHVAVVDLASGWVLHDFDLGAVDLTQVDATEDDIIAPDENLNDVLREPDAVAWLPVGRFFDLIATANEGDLFGGSRGFTLFGPYGFPWVDAGNSYEHLAIRLGHYPEGRSENKGSEPEAIEYGRFGRDKYLFVGSERGSFVAVYKLGWFNQPRLRQVLPGPLGPEGVLAIPSRDLLVVSGEEDDPDFGVRATIMIYELQRGPADYPQIVSADDASGAPIGWSALSGMVALPHQDDRMLAVWDSFYAESRVFRIDASSEPAVITEAVSIAGGSGDYDPEGIAIAPDGTVWIASEGGDPGERANRLLQLDQNGNVLAEIGLPDEIEACRAASSETGPLDNGFEGVAVLPGEGGYRLLAAQQLPWTYTTADCEALDDAPGFTRIWIYDPTSGAWGSVAYELAPVPANSSWVGLSEITQAPDGDYILIERDNRTGDFSGLKTLVKVSRAAGADGVVTADEKKVYDITPDLRATNGWITDKPEGVAITKDGDLYLVTDNDGVDDWSGETTFLNLGHYKLLFGEVPDPADPPF